MGGEDPKMTSDTKKKFAELLQWQPVRSLQVFLSRPRPVAKLKGQLPPVAPWTKGSETPEPNRVRKDGGN